MNDPVPPTAPSAAAPQPPAQALLDNFFKALAAGGDPGVLDALKSAGSPSPESLARLAELQVRLSQEHMQLWASMLTGGWTAAPGGDKRFAAQEWAVSPFHDYLRRSYLLNARFVMDAIEALDLKERDKERLRFAARQMTDAFSPANFAATNPEAIKLAMETQGASLLDGMRNFLGDVQKGRLSITDESAFEVGRNIATTEGAVVFRNDLIELIQYQPRTETVFSRPLLIVPPCINKFYILDLQPENSLVRHAIDQGHTVFVVSWRNVGQAQSRLTWDDYLEQGVLQALAVTRAIGGVKKINALGFCIGGTLLASALAVQAARGEDWVESLTLLAAMLDFADTGEIGLFVDEASVAAREAAVGQGGLVPGKELAMVFSSLRANDLVWPYVVNNYLKGHRPPAFDLLYWNADSTNLPGPMYCWYLRSMYLQNALREPGRLHMLGQPVDLGRLRMPSYMVATREDHIVPWKTAYRTTGLIKGERRFVLGASGHIAGIINPVSRNRRSYWLGEALPADPDAWLGQAVEHAGSWWNDWSPWLAAFGGRRRKARKQLGDAAHPPLAPAPGTYVKEQAG